MKKSSYAATHYGECQLCGHTQKLPGGGLLSIHGYEVRWNSFQGTCPGSRHLPYEQSIDLLAAEIVRQKAEIKRLSQWSKEVRAEKSNVWVQERVPASKYGYASTQVWRELIKADGDYKVEDGKIVWMTLQRGDAKPEQQVLRASYDSADRSIAGIIAAANGKKVASIDAVIEQRKKYAAWLAERIQKFVVRELRPIPVEEQGSGAVTLHALNAYYSKKTGRDEALCGSGSRFSGYSYKQIAKGDQKVTCKACLKALAAQAAEAVLSQKADALIEEMVVKFGPSVKTRFSDANGQAVSEIRYRRKEIDKAVRSLAASRLER